MNYWSEEDIKEMIKRNKKIIRHRKIAIGLAIPALLLALSLTVISVLANEPLWIVVFALFVAAIIYFIVRQSKFLKEDLNWKPRDPRDYHQENKS